MRDIATRVGLGAEGESHFSRIEVTEGKLRLSAPSSHGRTIRRNLDLSMTVQEHPTDARSLLLEVDAPIALPRSRPTFRAMRSYSAKRDPFLIQALRTSHAMLASTRGGVPHLEFVPRPRYDRRLARLAFLAPDIQRAILAGTQPNGLRLEDLVRNPMPASWREQREWIQRLAG